MYPFVCNLGLIQIPIPDPPVDFVADNLESYASVEFDDDAAVSDIDSINVALSDLSVTTTGAVWDPEEAEEYKMFIEQAKEAAKEGEQESKMRRKRFFKWLESAGRSM